MRPAYRTKYGRAFNCSIEEFIESRQFNDLVGRVDLILTSPPYPLVSPKAYGNRVGEDYRVWLSQVMVEISRLLKPKGSLVIEIGNAWDKGLPTMSTLPLETLLHIKSQTQMHLCQQFIWNNPNKLPGPATWVNVRRIRVKDAFTHIWWMSKSSNPLANNLNVLVPYTESMERLLQKQDYNFGKRPSGHDVGEGFLKRNPGAIPSNVLTFPNSLESAEYRDWCKSRGLPQHPARMPEKVAEFFVRLLTKPQGLVFDPFAGSNTTGKVSQDLHRRWVSIERDQKYVLGSRGRFN